MPRKPIVPRVGSSAAEPGPASAAGDEPARLRDALARWASGVAVLALREQDGLHAMTVTAFTAVSFDPPLVAVAVGVHAAIAPLLVEGADFAVSVLAGDQRRAANIFADVFPVDRSGFPSTGDAILAGSLAALVCRVETVHPAGDHRLVLGRVLRTALGASSSPLLYFDRAYRRLPAGE